MNFSTMIVITIFDYKNNQKRKHITASFYASLVRMLRIFVLACDYLDIVFLR